MSFSTSLIQIYSLGRQKNSPANASHLLSSGSCGHLGTFLASLIQINHKVGAAYALNLACVLYPCPLRTIEIGLVKHKTIGIYFIFLISLISSFISIPRKLIYHSFQNSERICQISNNLGLSSKTNHIHIQ